MSVTLLHGDCRNAMAAMEPESVDAIVTDPPYELGFMGKQWDAAGVSFDPETWRAAHRVLKPGGHLLAFGGTRTFHRIAVAIEDAGFEIRDTLSWLYGSGFPKSHDVGKAMDREANAEREVVGRSSRHGGGINHVYGKGMGDGTVPMLTAPATDLARQWDGWGTALKPAWEPIIVARKPLNGTVAQNVAQHGTGALNIDGCRIESEERKPVTGFHNRSFKNRNAQANDRPWMDRRDPDLSAAVQPHPAGRWPANVALDEGAAALLDEQSGDRGGSKPIKRDAGFQRFNGQDYNGGKPYTTGEYTSVGYGDTGGASRFFYVAKASRSERNAGLDGMPDVAWRGNYGDGIQDNRPHTREGYEYHAAVKNHHPTVKPIALMRWLVRLVTPPGGIVLDPFMGSGTTGVACVGEGVSFIGIEQEEDYMAIAERRIAHARGALPAAATA